jgi:DNA polymerase-3 subunit delta'
MTVFDRLVGQKLVIEQLKTIAANPALLTQSYLFVGSPGSGRSIAAKAFAAAIECDKGGCGVCKTCKLIDSDTCPDVLLVQTNKLTIKKEEVEALVIEALQPPLMLPKRIIIIEDADRITENTSNRLLKAIEEPNVDTIWMLSAPGEQDIIQTIRSRCKIIRLAEPSTDDIAKLLMRDGFSDEIASEAAAYSLGHIGLARKYAQNPALLVERNKLVADVLDLKNAYEAYGLAEDLLHQIDSESKDSFAQMLKERKAFIYKVHGIEVDRSGTDGGEYGGGDRGGELVGGISANPMLLRAIKSQITSAEKDIKLEEKRHYADIIDIKLSIILSIYTDISKLQAYPQAKITNRQFAEQLSYLAKATSIRENAEKIDAIVLARKQLHIGVQHRLLIEALLCSLL